ncbi:MAG: hypothetical protein JWL69_2171, partial [Phycisphaerales bacterium]|nr:hypothetical protein [Phycisphaerales bacterium]
MRRNLISIVSLTATIALLSSIAIGETNWPQFR